MEKRNGPHKAVICKKNHSYRARQQLKEMQVEGGNQQNACTAR